MVIHQTGNGSTIQLGQEQIMNSVSKLLVGVFALIASNARGEALPKWAESKNCSKERVTNCVVGFAHGYDTPEGARTAAWNDALIQIARSQFPFLQNISEETKESLNTASYQRSTSLDGRDVDWSFVEEDARAGSPMLQRDKQGKWNGFVLLRWNVKTMQTERSRLKELQSAIG